MEAQKKCAKRERGGRRKTTRTEKKETTVTLSRGDFIA